MVDTKSPDFVAQDSASPSPQSIVWLIRQRRSGQDDVYWLTLNDFYWSKNRFHSPKYATRKLAQDQILSAKLGSADAVPFVLYENGDLRPLHELEAMSSEAVQLRQAVGLLTTLHPSMVMRPDDPIGMAQEVVEKVRAERATADMNSRAVFDIGRALEGDEFGACSTVESTVRAARDVLPKIALLRKNLEQLLKNRDDLREKLARAEKAVAEAHIRSSVSAIADKIDADILATGMKGYAEHNDRLRLELKQARKERDDCATENGKLREFLEEIRIAADETGKPWGKKHADWIRELRAQVDALNLELSIASKGRAEAEKAAVAERADVDRLRADLRAVRETLWDCQTPDFPPFTPAADHLHYAYMPGDWSSHADEWFVYDRLMRNGHPTRLVRVRWRHGPGIPNSDPAVPYATRGFAGVVERLRKAELDTSTLRAENESLKGLGPKHYNCRATLSPKREPEPCTRPPCTDPGDLLELACGLLANVSGGDWHAQDPKWHGAVIAWRDDWHRWLESSRITRRGGLVDSAIRKAAGDPPHPLVRDPATGALGVKVGIVRDPVAGWTFDKFRAENERLNGLVLSSQERERQIANDLNGARDHLRAIAGAIEAVLSSGASPEDLRRIYADVWKAWRGRPNG